MTLNKADPNAGVASMREELRKQKGDTAVAELDAAMAGQEELAKDIRALINEHLNKNLGGDDFAMAAVVEMLSQMFAEHCVRFGKAKETKDPVLVTLAIASITNNLQFALEQERLAEAPTDWLANLKGGEE